MAYKREVSTQGHTPEGSSITDHLVLISVDGRRTHVEGSWRTREYDRAGHLIREYSRDTETNGRDWKNEHASAASVSIRHDLVEGVIEEFLDNVGIADNGLPAYGIRKVALYAAQVARAHALGFDPELLRMTPSEANSHQMEIAATAVLLGIPVQMVEPPGGQS